MNMNILFDVLTSFKIKFTEHPSPTQVSNMDLIFKVEEEVFSQVQAGVVIKRYNKRCMVKGVQLGEDKNSVEIILAEN